MEWPNISAILFAPLTIIIAFCLIAFVKSGAKIQNFLQTISFPPEKLTNRHEKGAESRADILGLRLPVLALLHIIISYSPSVVAVFFGNYIFLGLFMLQCEKSFVTLQPIKAIEV